MKLTKSQFPNKEWPFTVDTVYVTMKESGGLKLLLIKFYTVGFRYGLNGLAQNYEWTLIPYKYRQPSIVSEHEDCIIYVSLTWFIKYCLDNVKKS